jgi:sigma-54 dependent transcriptional regulator, acetoin dehydrogenase operon transcriptional activator AcoR
MVLSDKLAEKGSELIKPFSSLSGLDMAIEDEKGFVLGGTGRWEKKVGTYRPEGSYFDLTLKTGEPYACTDPKFSPQCYKCPIRTDCPYSFTASHPIIFNGEVHGLIGYLGYKNTERDFFLEKKAVLMEALEELTSCLTVVYDDQKRWNRNSSSSLFEDILNELNEGIMFLDSRLRVTYVNKAASSMLESSPRDLLGKGLKTKLPDLANAFKNLDKNCNEDKLNSVVKSSKHGVLNLYQWNNSETRFVIFKDRLVGNRGSISHVNNRIAQDDNPFDVIVGDGKSINDTKQLAARLAQSDACILVYGETGVGKELFAQAIHKASIRRDKPFVVVNCAAIPDNLVESELFGYEEGAFSGARLGGKPGKFEAAAGGTLFLDEIGELPLNAQGKLLRSVEQMEIAKIGATQPRKVNVRIIAASNRNLKTLVDDGKFREDLYYRLNIMPLRIPPLRERVEDIPDLLSYYFEFYDRPASELYSRLTPRSLNMLLAYHWPGNVRELKNVCQYLAVNVQKGDIDLSMLPQYIFDSAGEADSYKQENIKPRSRFTSAFCDVADKTKLTIDEVMINQALKRYGYHTLGKRKAAAALGISLSTLYRRLRRYNLDL